MMMQPEKKIAFGSVATVSYLRQAFAMALSLRASGDTTNIFILVPDLINRNVDEIVDEIALNHVGIEILNIDDLHNRPPELSRFYYNAFEYANMLKPFLIMELLRRGFSCVTYLDSDLMFVSPLSVALAKLHVDHVGFTPHLLSPQADPESIIQDSDLCQTGVLNGGFYVVSNTDRSRSIINWMIDTFARYGFVDYREGLFVDQKLLQNAFFHFFPDVELIRHPGYNIAYWNADERLVEVRDGEFRTEQGPVLFFHLSGMAPDDENTVCRYLNGAKNKSLLDRNPWFRDVYAVYSEFWQEAADFIRNDEFEYPFRSIGRIELSNELRRWIFRNQTTKLGKKQVISGLVRMLGLRARKLLRL